MLFIQSSNKKPYTKYLIYTLLFELIIRDVSFISYNGLNMIAKITQEMVNIFTFLKKQIIYAGNKLVTYSKQSS